MNLRDIPFIQLNVDIDHKKLLSEYKEVEKRYSFENYKPSIGSDAHRKKYASAWSGICLISSEGELYSGLRSGNNSVSGITELIDVCPYYYELMSKLGGGDLLARIMRIAPKESLLWHSHVLEHGQEEWKLTCQVPIIMPNDFEYCVVHKDDFEPSKKFYKPEQFKKIWRKKLSAGKAYIFNSYHYHNVFNYTDEYRVTLMFYLDSRTEKVKKNLDEAMYI